MTPAIQDLLAGQVDFAMDSGSSVSHIRSGRLRLLATGSEKRSPLFPDTPTLRELRTLMEHDSQRYGAIIRKQKIQAD